VRKRTHGNEGDEIRVPSVRSVESMTEWVVGRAVSSWLVGRTDQNRVCQMRIEFEAPQTMLFQPTYSNDSSMSLSIGRVRDPFLVSLSFRGNDSTTEKNACGSEEDRYCSR
jgi:hypothetical protein